MLVASTERTPPDTEDSSWRWTTLAQILPVLTVMLFNLITLWPECHIGVPSLNDDAEHFLFVQRADAALAEGENPVDNWSPVLELGFPQFFYYQHVPHLAVALIYRLLFKRVGLLTLFNVVRYLLLVFLPLTVWWSMRTIGFTPAAATVAAAFAPLISANYLYGFEYNSYVWRGFGMYTQLWAMHFLFVAIACLHRVLNQGRGYVSAIVACSMVVLSDLMYAYILAITAAVLFLVSLRRNAAA
jgi:uncharacterized membrane protein